MVRKLPGHARDAPPWTAEPIGSTNDSGAIVSKVTLVAGALIVFGLLDALRGRILARAGAWLEGELGAPVLSGAVADALRVGGGVSAQGLRDLAAVRGYVGGASVMPLFDARVH